GLDSSASSEATSRTPPPENSPAALCVAGRVRRNAERRKTAGASRMFEVQAPAAEASRMSRNIAHQFPANKRRQGRLIDMTGRRFGRLTVLAIYPERYRWPGGTFALWLCRCDCGTERVVLGNSLRRGASTNCGCLKREKFIRRVTKHGLSATSV